MGGFLNALGQLFGGGQQQSGQGGGLFGGWTQPTGSGLSAYNQSPQLMPMQPAQFAPPPVTNSSPTAGLGIGLGSLLQRLGIVR